MQNPARITATAVDASAMCKVRGKKKKEKKALNLFYYILISSQSIPKLKACRTEKNRLDFEVLYSAVQP